MPIPRRARNAVRAVVRTANTPMARARFRTASAAAPRPIALEVGGVRPRPGWLVVNVNAVARNYMDATAPWAFEDESMSHVYADNMIEHVPLEAARAMLREAHRCLRPGGTIRLVTPDVRHHVDLYLRGREALTEELAGFYREIGVVVEHPVDLLRTPIGEFGHHSGYVYDFEAMDSELQRAGFSPARRCGLGESDDPVLRGLEKRTGEGSAQLVIEADR